MVRTALYIPCISAVEDESLACGLLIVPVTFHVQCTEELHRRLAVPSPFLASESSGTSAIWEDGEVLEGAYTALVFDSMLLGSVLQLLP